MKHRAARAGALAVLGIFLLGTARAQNAPNNDSRPSLKQPQPQQGGDTAKDDKAPPPPSPDDEAFQAVFGARNDEPANVIQVGEAFLAKYPMSEHLLAVYSILTPAYMEANQLDKMFDVGGKALQMDPNNVDVLPILAWTVPRRTNAQTPEGLQLLQKAQAWARHGIELLTALPKPDELDAAEFESARNEKLSMCHDALGVVALKTGKYDEAITELTQSMQLAHQPDLTDDFLLGLAQEATNHFTDAIASFTKCAANGPVQTQCKTGIDDAKKKEATSAEPPK